MFGTVFNIQRFSVNDGPGIRTTVFLKGCPLDCAWCHNPESKSVKPELSYDPNRCIGCGACAAVCENGCHTMTAEGHGFDRANCAGCGKCADECVGTALERIGQLRSAEDVVADVLRDKPFYENSGGGMTVSGGEPLAQPEFLLELLRLAKEKDLSTAIETSGFAPWARIEAILPYTDLFLFDVKETDPERHRDFTRAPLAPIRENLLRLDDAGAKIILRCPLIPGYNARDEHLAAIAALANSLHNVQRIDVEPYHPLGASKARNIGREYRVGDLPFPPKEQADEWIAAIQSGTSVPVGRA